MNTGEIIPLPEGEFVFGLADHDHHIITRTEALEALELVGEDPRLVTAASICRRLVGLATAWGPYSHTAALLHPGRCADCAWIYALHHGETEQEITTYTSLDEIDAAAIAAAGGDPHLGRRLLTAIGEDSKLDHGSQLLEPSQRSQLLAQASRHLPVIARCEECLEIGISNAHSPGTECPCQEIICPGCTISAAGSWAGEWEGTLLPECTVTAPCAVLRTMAAHYRIEINEMSELR